MEKENILGIDVCITNYDQLFENIVSDIDKNKKAFVVAINPEKVLKARHDKQFKNILNSADYQIPDGIGIIWASKIKNGRINKRITGIDAMIMLCDLSSKKGYRVFLYGAEENVIHQTEINLKKQYPNLQIVGTMNGYEKNNKKIIDSINKSKADIIFIGTGSPRQERWIYNNMNNTCVKIFQGVGGSFDVISGKSKRASKLLQNMGLEWLYRLVKEPKRFFRQLKLIEYLFLCFFK